MSNATPIWWTGPICGIGNRLIAMAAVKACSDGREVVFPWSNDPSCPGEYADIFEPMPEFRLADAPPAGSIEIATGWEPFEIFEQFRDTLRLQMSSAEFGVAFVRSLRGLKFREMLVMQSNDWRDAQECDALLGVHIRRTDRAAQHRQQFRDFLTGKFGLNRELPAHWSALYGLAPESIVARLEDKVLARAAVKYLRNGGSGKYRVFSDSLDQVQGFETAIASLGEAVHHDERKKPPSPAAPDSALRRTTISAAALDLLSLARCDAIAQNNRASTFSLVAAMLGSKPIITAKTRYPFWLRIETETGRAPNDELLSN